VTVCEEVASVLRSAQAQLSAVGEHVDLMPLIGIEGISEGWARRIDAAIGAIDAGPQAGRYGDKDSHRRFAVNQIVRKALDAGLDDQRRSS